MQHNHSVSQGNVTSQCLPSRRQDQRFKTRLSSASSTSYYPHLPASPSALTSSSSSVATSAYLSGMILHKTQLEINNFDSFNSLHLGASLYLLIFSSPYWFVKLNYSLVDSNRYVLLRMGNVFRIITSNFILSIQLLPAHIFTFFVSLSLASRICLKNFQLISLYSFFICRST